MSNYWTTNDEDALRREREQLFETISKAYEVSRDGKKRKKKETDHFEQENDLFTI